ncbi:MAG: hypothetical protein EB165_03585 [Euryarchaeota archaeon]|jgi:hypothetical protein|nr:hypothetical protein [Euryarchaeota archaeon]
MSNRLKPTAAKAAQLWKDFYHTDGRAAIALLFYEFNLYSPAPDNDPYSALRREGQRDVLLRIVQLIGLKPEDFASRSWDDADIIDRILNNNVN